MLTAGTSLVAYASDLGNIINNPFKNYSDRNLNDYADDVDYTVYENAIIGNLTYPEEAQVEFEFEGEDYGDNMYTATKMLDAFDNGGPQSKIYASIASLTNRDFEEEELDSIVYAPNRENVSVSVDPNGNAEQNLHVGYMYYTVNGVNYYVGYPYIYYRD